MTPATDTKTRRVEIRLSEEERQSQEAAAAQLGLTLSEFIRQSALQRAAEVQEERERATLSATAAARFLELLDDDRGPQDGLVELFRRPSHFTY